jgi:membrane protein YqaA with SNARE-associated domain
VALCGIQSGRSRFPAQCMPYRLLVPINTPSSRSVVSWLLHLGGVGLIPLGLLDSSVVPVPGSMDVATILLAARDKPLWFYYALMATAGSVLGAFLTYRLARRGGKAALSKRFPERKVKKTLKSFERWGFAAVLVPALLPPPFPLVPFLVAAGALQYPLPKFLTALGAGRLARYFILAFLGAHYGRQILSAFSRHVAATLYVSLAVMVAAVVIALLLRAKQGARKSA